MKKGFSIVEVLVAVAISSVVGAAMWTLIDNALSNSSYYLDRQEYDDAIRQIQFVLMRSDQCADALGSTDDTPGTPHQRVSFDGSATNVFGIFSKSLDGAGVARSVRLVQSNAPYGRVRIGQMTLQETRPNTGRSQEVLYEPNPTNPKVPLAVTYDTYLVSLVIPGATRTGKDLSTGQFSQTGETRFASSSIPFKVYVKRGTSRIDRCILSNVDNQMCGAFGGLYSSTTKKCEMDDCNASSPRLALDCPTSSFTTCTKSYFWGYTSDNTNTEPVCLCQLTCVAPPPPPPPPTPRY